MIRKLRESKINLVVAVSLGLLLVYLAPVLINGANGQPIFILLPSSDTAPTALLPVSILRDGDFFLDEYAPFFRDNWSAGAPFLRATQGHLASIYPVVAAILAVPVYAVPVWAGWGAQPGAAFTLARIAAAMLTAGALGLFLLICLERLPARQAVGVTLAFGLGTSAWTTASQGLWQHTASLPLLFGALWLLITGERDARRIPWAGLLLSAATAARYNNATTWVLLGGYVCLRYRRQFPAFVALGALPLLAWLAYNQLIFGSPFELSYGAAGNGWTADMALGFAGLLISPAKGLLIFSPFLVLALIGAVRALRQPRSLEFFAFGAFAIFTLVMSRWWSWYGGWSYGNRMLTDALPLLGVLLLPMCERLSRGGWWLFGAASVFAVGAHALGVFDYGVNWHHTFDTGDNWGTWLWNIKASPILFYAYHYAHRVLATLSLFGYPR